MRKLFYCLAMFVAAHANAQEDITAKYIRNASFEQDDITSLTKDTGRGAYKATSLVGWSVTMNMNDFAVSDIMTKDATATDNNFGKPGTPSDGSQMYYMRHSWTVDQASLLQTVTLPKGKYRLTVDNKCISAAAHTAALVAGTETAALSFSGSMPSQWATTSVDFELTAEKSVTIGIKAGFINAGGGSIIIDNFRLYDVSKEVVPEDPTEKEVSSHTEGVITQDFVPEATMKNDLLQMLADFSKYMVDDWNQCAAPNSIGETCGFFKGENSGGSDERGVRPNADLSMVCAFLVKYAKPAGVTLPTGVTWDKIEQMAMQSLVFAYSTHKANKLKVCSGNGYWGSTSTSDVAWESSLWAMSVAYSAYFQWEKLSEAQKNYIYKLLKAECNYELYRSIPTGYAGDTKAEENGWEADILAATLGLFPNDELAPKWFERLREFAINSYSHTSDAGNGTVIDEWYDNKTVADLYKGANLYDDYSLQNHNLFHTSYQNVVMQELGEAALALKMFQTGLHGTEKWRTNALMHHNQEVQDSILNWLALADGELAMPNGNDWSLFLYDQITSYTTQACFQRDANALMLENMAYKYIKARQKTTTDGSWLLRADVGARRMGVEAHRVMMTYLMHDVLSTADLTPTAWDDFNRKYSEAKMIPCQNVVRAATDSRFTCFSWSNGLKSYTGYFAANSADKNKIVVPYRANNTGNITGWYEVSGKATDATPVVSGIYKLEGNGYVMNGEMNVNAGALNNRFAIYSTPQNALIYLDYVTAKSACTITAEKGGMLAISTDELMKLKRTLYYGVKDDESGEIRHKQLDGTAMTQFNSDWVNVDNELGVVSVGNGKKIAFGDRGANNSIYTSKLYPMYSNTSRSVAANAVADARNLVYYSLQKAEDTQSMATKTMSLKSLLPTGWNGVIAPDAGCAYLLVSNFKGTENTAAVEGIQYDGYAPVFRSTTTVSGGKSSTTFAAQQNNSVAQPLTVFLKGIDAEAQLIDETSAYVTAKADGEVTVAISNNYELCTMNYALNEGETARFYLSDGKVCMEKVEKPRPEKTKDYTSYIVNPKFEGNSSYGWTGAPTVNYNSAEKFNTTFNVYQTVTGLPEGLYILGVQGFYRDGSYANAASHRTAGTEAHNAIIYANDSTLAMQSIYDAAGKKGAVGVNQQPYGYIPDNMEQAHLYFSSGLYRNALLCSVGSDGKLTLGVKKTVSTASDWCIFSNFTLTYLGVPGDADADGVVTVADANAIVSRYLGLPADIDEDAADINRDGSITISDANAVVNRYVSK